MAYVKHSCKSVFDLAVVKMQIIVKCAREKFVIDIPLHIV